MDTVLYFLLLSKIKSKIKDDAELKRIYDEIVSISRQVSDDKNSIESFGTVQVTDVKPKSENVDVWINDNNYVEYTFPEVNDEEINELDTWSSKHINEELQSIYNSIATDEEVNAYLFGK